MQALFLADTADLVFFVFLRHSSKACDALTAAGYRARLIDVVAVRVANKPGELANLMDYLDENNINVEYAHCFIVGDFAYDVLKVNDPSLDVKLSAAGFKVCKPEDVYVVD